MHNSEFEKFMNIKLFLLSTISFVITLLINHYLDLPDLYIGILYGVSFGIALLSIRRNKKFKTR